MTAPESGPPVIVRPATLGDVDALVALVAEVAGEGRWIATEAPVDVEERHHTVAEAVQSDHAIVLVAEVGGELAGDLGLHLARYGVADLGMAVLAAWRGRGVGTPCSPRGSTRPGRPGPTRSPSRSGPTTAPPSPSTSGSASSARAT